MATAERAAHSLKGAAGNLGAAALAEAAAKAESRDQKRTGCRDGDRVAGTVARSRGEGNPRGAAGRGLHQRRGPAAADPAAVAASLSRLKKLLENDDGEAAEFILDARPNLSGMLTGAEIDTLAGLVGDFDFEAALKCLAAIATRLALNLE